MSAMLFLTRAIIISERGHLVTYACTSCIDYNAVSNSPYTVAI